MSRRHRRGSLKDLAIMALALAVVALFCFTPPPTPSSGSPASTTYETEGIIRSVDEEHVTLDLPDGTSTTVPIKELNLHEDLKDRVGWELHVTGEMRVE